MEEPVRLGGVNGREFGERNLRSETAAEYGVVSQGRDAWATQKLLGRDEVGKKAGGGGFQPPPPLER